MIYYDKEKYYSYKKILELLRIVYNNIKNYDSIELNGVIYNYLTEPNYIYDLISDSSYKLYNILNNNVSTSE